MLELTAPFLAVAATDGCFGYVRSPMHFEHLLLSTLRDARDPTAWSARLQEEVSAVTGDDAAMAVLGNGADHRGFQDLLAGRTAELEERWVAPLDALADEVAEAERAFVEARTRQSDQAAQLWAAYKTGYGHYLVDASAPATSDDAAPKTATEEPS